MKFLQRVEDFFRGQKDKSEIINTQQFSFSETYMWNGEKMVRDTSKLNSEISFTNNENINWIKSNPGKFYIKQLAYIERMSIEVIKPQLFLKDIVEISFMEKLDILGVEFDFDDWKNIYATVWFREQDFEEGDGMPNDILEYFLSEVKNRLKKKAEYYIKNYNILSSRKTTQKMKYRTSPLYSTKRQRYLSVYDLRKGLFNLEIAINFN